MAQGIYNKNILERLELVNQHRSEQQFLEAMFRDEREPYSVRWRAKRHLFTADKTTGQGALIFLTISQKELSTQVDPANSTTEREFALDDAILLGREKPIILELESLSKTHKDTEERVIHPRYWTDPVLISVYNTDPLEKLRSKAGSALGYTKARLAFHQAKRHSPYLWQVEDILRLRFLKK